MSGLGIRARLALLLALLLALMAVAAGYALVQLRGVTTSVQSVYDDRVMPLFQLRAVSDTYVVGLPRIAREVLDGKLGTDEALAQLDRSRREARTQWLRYKATHLVPREKELLAQAEPLFSEAERAADRYAAALASGAERSSPLELGASAQPFARVLAQLAQLQADEVRAAAMASHAAYGGAVWAMAALVGLAAAVGVGLAWAVAVGYGRERREREQQAEHLSHCYAALSRANQMIVRVRDEQLMYEELCRICLDTKLARVAVVMLAELDGALRFAASAGPAKALFAGLPFTLNHPEGRAAGPVAVALRDGRIDVSNDYLNDPRVAQFHARAREHGVLALGAFPVRRGGAVVGCLALYVNEVNYFDAARVRLLDEMAGDLSFALDNIDRNAAHAVAEREVEAGYDRVRQIFNLMPVAILLVSRRTGCVVLANATSGERYGMAPEAMEGRMPADMGVGLSPQDRARFYAAIDADGRVHNFEGQVRTARGEVLDLLTSAELIDYMGEPCALTVSLDITERKRREHAEQARHDAETSSRAKTEFLSRMSHELRTPLNAVLGFSQLMQTNAQEPLSARQREQVEAIRQAGWHLLALVNDVLDVSRIESGHLRVESYGVNLLTLLDEVAALVQPLADSAKVQIHRLDGEGPALVLGDPLRLRQVLVNLLTNAIKYNRPGGVVSVEIERAGACVGLSVADTGLGMSPEQLDGLFEPFNRLGRENSHIEGTGIGLVLTRQLLTLMQGTLDVESEVGLGTTVFVTLEKAEAMPMALAGPESGSGAGPSLGTAPGVDEGEPPEGLVLYIEDNPINLLLVEQLLLRWPGVRLVQAETGGKGIELARALRPDLVLLDMRLPDMSGPEVLEALRADGRTRELRVVALSASAMPAEVALARASGAYDYWTKPIDFERFTADMKRLLSRAVSPA